MADIPHLLLVDDERSIREPLARYLAKQGFRITQAGDAAAARTRLAAYAIDLVILDVMMPGEDGLSLCRHIRATGELPVILLTARAEETDRIVGLEMGADDYVVKPFSPRELATRVKVVRSQPPVAVGVESIEALRRLSEMLFAGDHAITVAVCAHHDAARWREGWTILDGGSGGQRGREQTDQHRGSSVSGSDR